MALSGTWIKMKEKKKKKHVQTNFFKTIKQNNSVNVPSIGALLLVRYRCVSSSC